MSLPPLRPTAIALYVYRTASAKRPRTPPYEFLQLLRSKKAHGLQHSWQTVYGGIKKKESAPTAALRELKEETNLAPTRMFQVEYLESFYFRQSDSLLLMPVFAAEISPKSKITLNHEHTAHRWIPASQIKKSFMWQSQIQALTQLLAQLRHPTPSAPFLEIDLP